MGTYFPIYILYSGEKIQGQPTGQFVKFQK